MNRFRWCVWTLLVVTVFLAGCVGGLNSPGPSPGPGPGNGGNNGPSDNPKLGSLSVNFELIDMDDVHKIKVDMKMHAEGSIVTVPVASGDLTIDRDLGSATGEVRNLLEGLWNLEIVAEYASNAKRTTQMQIAIEGGKAHVLEGQLSPDPNNASKLSFTSSVAG